MLQARGGGGVVKAPIKSTKSGRGSANGSIRGSDHGDKLDDTAKLDTALKVASINIEPVEEAHNRRSGPSQLTHAATINVAVHPIKIAKDGSLEA